VSDSPLIRQAYRFELAPTPAQEELLGSFTGASRFFFNWGLRLVKTRLALRTQLGPSIAVPWSYKELCSEFAKVKDEVAPWRGQVVCGSQQAGLEMLGRALQNYTQSRRRGRRVGFPRFRAKGRSHEAAIFQRGRPLNARHVQLDRRLGPLRSKERLSKLTRLLQRDERARILRATIKRSQGGRWFISFTVERSPKQRQARLPRAAVGMDVGVRRLATLSTGQLVENGRPLEKALAKLCRLQRQLDRQRRANNPNNYDDRGRIKAAAWRVEWLTSRRMLGTQERIRCLHERVAHLRREQAHQLTSFLTREFGVIGTETLNVKGMLRDKQLARHVADVGWGRVLFQLAYKTSWSAGSLLVAADRFYPSSKTCSACGSVRAKLDRGEHVFTCEKQACGLALDRDLNAALNLARMAQQHAQAEGISKCYVAATGAETQNARRGQVSLVNLDEHSPLKREGSQESSQRREPLAPALA
jgi:putative transposase